MKITFDNDSWLEEGNEIEINYENNKKEFSLSDNLLITISLEKKSFFNQNILSSLRLLQKDLSKIPVIDKINSPLTQTTVINEEGLYILSYDEAIKKQLLSIQSYKKDFLDSIYMNGYLDETQQIFLLSLDLKYETTINNDLQRQELISSIKEILNSYPSFKSYRIVGEEKLLNELNERNYENLKLLLVSAIFILFIIIVIIYKSMVKVFIIMLVAFLALISTLAIQNILGYPMSIIGLVLPVLISIVAISDVIHILSIRQWLYSENNYTNFKLLMKSTWKPCFLTSITTAIGFGSFYFSELVPLIHLGISSFVSILVVFVVIVSSSWILIYLFESALIKSENNSLKSYNVQIQKITLYISKYKNKITFFSIIALFLTSTSLFFIKIETNFLDVFFFKDSKIYKDFEFVDNHLFGTGKIEVILEAKSHDFFKELSVLENMKKLNNKIRNHLNVKKVYSYLDSIHIVHKAFTKGEDDFPKNDDELAQELLFLEFSRNDVDNDVLAPFLTFDYKKARIDIFTKNLNTQELENLLKDIKKDVNSHFDGEVKFLGSSTYFYYLSKYILDTQVKSILITIFIIAFILSIIFGIKYGFISLFVNIVPIVFTSSLIILLGKSFDFSTVLIASICLGLAVDSSIHLLYHFERFKDMPKRLEKTLSLSVKPIVIITILLCSTFAVFLISDLVVLFNFGLFSIVMIIFCLFLNLLLLPSILSLVIKN